MMAGRRRALIIAVDEYDHPGLKRLRSPAADAEALCSVLGDPRIGDFEVEVVQSESAHEIQVRLEDLFSEAKADDFLVVHFSGHGLKGEAGDLFFAARNTRPNRLASTAVPAEFVQRCIRTSPSRSIVLLLDCCYGGAFGQGVAVRAAGDMHVLESFPSDRLGGRGRAVITASNSMEYAFEGERLSDDNRLTPSVFTAALVEGMSTGEADRNGDGLVSLNELYDYVSDRVRERNPNQTPSRDIEMQGDFYLAKSGRRRLEAAPLPLDLQAAIKDANSYTRLGAIIELRSRLLSENLSAAMGASAALAAMAASDTQVVAAGARAGLDELVLHVTPTSLDFGEAPIASTTAPRRIELSGPPLALHVNVRASEPWIKIQEDRTSYALSVTPSAAGEMHGTVTFSGAAGDVVVDIRAIGVDLNAVSTAGRLERTESGGPARPRDDVIVVADTATATTTAQQNPSEDEAGSEGKRGTEPRADASPLPLTPTSDVRDSTQPVRPSREFPTLPRVAYAALRKRLLMLGDVTGAFGVTCVQAGLIVTLFTIDQPKTGKLFTAFALLALLAGLRLTTGEWRERATQALTAGSCGLVTGLSFALEFGDYERLTDVSNFSWSNAFYVQIAILATILVALALIAASFLEFLSFPAWSHMRLRWFADVTAAATLVLVFSAKVYAIASIRPSPVWIGAILASVVALVRLSAARNTVKAAFPQVLGAFAACLAAFYAYLIQLKLAEPYYEFYLIGEVYGGIATERVDSAPLSLGATTAEVCVGIAVAMWVLPPVVHYFAKLGSGTIRTRRGH